jgi:hypothetical protein
LNIAAREKRHLLQTTERLFVVPIDAGWVKELENDPEVSERLDAFVVRFSRLQDMVGDKLVPELLKNALETPGSMLDNLNRMEKWDLLDSVVDWVEARNLQNQLVHEYMQDPEAFSQALHRARELVPLLTMTYDKIHEYAEKLRLGAR